MESWTFLRNTLKGFVVFIKEGLKISGKGLAGTKVEDKSDYLGSTSVETRSPTDQLAVGE